MGSQRDAKTSVGGAWAKKIELIKSMNPDWEDLYNDIKDW